MNEFTTLLQQGNAWFFIPSAILLGALHGLEPGHSKTMMAAFIIAIKRHRTSGRDAGCRGNIVAHCSRMADCFWRDVYQ